MKIISPLNAVFYTLNGKNKARRSIYIKIELEKKDRKQILHMSGVEAPTLGGDCLGSCGQIYQPFSEYDQPQFNEGWDIELYNKMIEVWKRWHLNDMQAECEHQRALGWSELAQTEVELYHYKLTPEALKHRNSIEKLSIQKLQQGETVTLSKEDQKISALSYSFTSHLAILPDQLAPLYTLEKTENKTLGWLNETEHPQGLLSKPCPTCKYPRGSAWNYEAIPDSVLDFLNSLPDATTKPAWI